MSKTRRWGSWAASGLTVLFLVGDSVGKFLQPQAVVDGTVELGWPVDVLTGLGAALLASTVLYAIPRTAVLGAILLTGYLGGAVATHVRVHDPLFTHTLFPVYMGVIAWGGLWLRDPRIQTLIPLRSAE